ncbi:MAG: GNAT family N-acetyltransferase, partial [Chloroflexota bacterium]
EPHSRIIDPTIEIRQVTPKDRASLADISSWLARFHTQAPIWAVARPEDLPALREGYANLVDDEMAIGWLALQNDEIAGFQVYFITPPAEDDLLMSNTCLKLIVAGTFEEFQGQGIGQALTYRALSEARRQGYQACLTDWRTANPLAARFWPQQGFQPAMYRLRRRIDERILWAHGVD